jgi:hypothetical protein
MDQTILKPLLTFNGCNVDGFNRNSYAKAIKIFKQKVLVPNLLQRRQVQRNWHKLQAQALIRVAAVWVRFGMGEGVGL